jgi:CheY-like chemotaxis protein
VSSFCPHVILLDMQMPVMDGWQFARAYRQRTITAPLVIMTSARDASGYAAEISADGYVSKPFAADDLLREVRRLGGGHTAAALAVAVEDLLARRQRYLRALEWARRHTAAIESTPTDHLRERLLALDEELRRLLDQLEASTPPEDPER